nr:PKD-like family lipoprotein [Odoribacter splanchnicus]
MNKIILLIGVLCLMACFDDKGNYDYHDIVEVSIDENENTSFVKNQYDYLEITPKIKYSQEGVNENDFTYQWAIYLDGYVSYETEMEIISNELNLKYQLSQDANTLPYAVVLYITNKKNRTVSQIKYSVTIHPTISSGILALYETSGGSDFDYIATPNAVPTLNENVWMKGVNTTVNGKLLAGSPQMISALRLNKQPINHVYVATDQSMQQLSGEDFSLTTSFEELFYEMPTTWKPQKMLRKGSYATIFINDKEAHCIDLSTSPAFSYIFSDPLPSTEAVGEIEIAPFIYMPTISSYPVAKRGVLYDEFGQRFVRVMEGGDNALDAFPEQKAEALFDVNHIGKDCKWFGEGYNSYGYALFADNELYCADFNMAEKVGGGWFPKPNEAIYNLSVAKYNLSAMPEIDHARYFACGKYAPVFLYATEEDIYACLLGSNPSAAVINNPFADGEKITGIMVYNPDTDIMYDYERVAGTLLYVSTWNGTEGKIYEFAIIRNTGQLGNAKEPLNVFGGMGKIVDMCIKLQGID